MLNWMSLEDVSFNSILLLEQVQLSWLKKSSISKKDLGIALKHNPVVFWYIVNKCPEIADFVTDAMNQSMNTDLKSKDEIRKAELQVLSSIEDWLVYVLDPKIYDQQPFLNWD